MASYTSLKTVVRGRRWAGAVLISCSLFGTLSARAETTDTEGARETGRLGRFLHVGMGLGVYGLDYSVEPGVAANMHAHYRIPGSIVLVGLSYDHVGTSAEYEQCTGERCPENESAALLEGTLHLLDAVNLAVLDPWIALGIGPAWYEGDFALGVQGEDDSGSDRVTTVGVAVSGGLDLELKYVAVGIGYRTGSYGVGTFGGPLFRFQFRI